MRNGRQQPICRAILEQLKRIALHDVLLPGHGTDDGGEVVVVVGRNGDLHEVVVDVDIAVERRQPNKRLTSSIASASI